jgi:hypothetical protein
MRKLLPALLAIITFAPACSFVVKKVNNVKQPQTESPESLNSWLSSQRLDKYEVLSVDPKYFYQATTFYMKRKLIFNQFGKVAELGTNKTGVVCHKTSPREVHDLEPGYTHFTEFLLDSIGVRTLESNGRKSEIVRGTDTIYYNIDSLNKYAHDLDGQKANIEKDFTFDYLVVIPFAKYQGKTVQVSDIRKYLKAIHENKYSRFKIILLNLDKQAWWGEEWNKKIRFVAG